MDKVDYLLVDSSILPDVYHRVIYAKNLLAGGEASSASQAAKMAGISRSAYYKYKDKIFEYSEQSDDVTTVNAKLSDNAGVLSGVMNEIYLLGANVLSVNQSIPVNSVADVSITVRMPKDNINTTELIDKIKILNGVKSVNIGGQK